MPYNIIVVDGFYDCMVILINDPKTYINELAILYSPF